jgi:hypothetical protein
VGLRELLGEENIVDIDFQNQRNGDFKGAAKRNSTHILTAYWKLQDEMESD